MHSAGLCRPCALTCRHSRSVSDFDEVEWGWEGGRELREVWGFHLKIPTLL